MTLRQLDRFAVCSLCANQTVRGARRDRKCFTHWSLRKFVVIGPQINQDFRAARLLGIVFIMNASRAAVAAAVISERPHRRPRNSRVREEALERRRRTLYALGVCEAVAMLFGPVHVERRLFIEGEREGRDDTVVAISEAICHTREDKPRARVAVL